MQSSNIYTRKRTQALACVHTHNECTNIDNPAGFLEFALIFESSGKKTHVHIHTLKHNKGNPAASVSRLEDVGVFAMTFLDP